MLRNFFRLFVLVFSFGAIKMKKAGDAMLQNPDVAEGEYNSVIRSKEQRIKQYEGIVADLVTNQKLKEEQLKNVTAQIEKTGKAKAGAKAKTVEVVEKYKAQGITDPEQLKGACEKDPIYLKHQGAFKDFSTTLDELNVRATGLDADVKKASEGIARHTNQLMSDQRAIVSLKTEKGEAIADIEMSKRQQDAANAARDLSTDNTSERLQALRNQRAKANAQAQVAVTLAGTDAESAVNEYVSSAESSVHTAELDEELFGIPAKKEVAKAVEAVTAAAPVPES